MKKALRFLAAVFFAVMACGPAFAIGSADLTDLNVLTPSGLASLLMGSGATVLEPVSFTGDPISAGTFQNGLADGLGLDSGIILTTGDILNAVGPNFNGLSGTVNLRAGDAGLDVLIGEATHDAAVLEFDFTTQAGTVTFQFVFASDEYNEENAANDVFALFIDGSNIALVPVTSNPVTINNLNQFATPLLFFNNDVDFFGFPTPFGTQYDGFSTVLTASANIAPGVVHHLKLAIADAGDEVVDSAVFIRSAALPAATFADVPPGAFAFNQIEAIAAAGITGGCSANPPLFCPNSPITRKEMAVFLETSLGVAPVPPCAGNVFVDITAASVGAAFCGFIEDFAARGITGGCSANPPLFCPDGLVTRAEMAVFIEAALGNPANACTGLFLDVPAGSFACGFIERLASDGITGGCGAGNFCPGSPVTRAQMAVFLVAAPPPLLP